MLAHGHDFGYDGIVGPFDTKDLGELLEVLGGSLTDREDSVAKPAHTETAQLLVEEFDAELRGEKGNVFNDRQPHAPLLVLGKLDDGGEEGLGEKLDANNCA